MVAAGVPTPRPDHAIVLAQLALDMLDCVKHERFLGGKHPIEIRIGLNSGSLLGGVIGRKKYFYALWGDTVNTASRYVVVSFAVNRYPRLEDRLNVYRQGLKVGEVKVNGPQLGENFVADLVSGEAAVGDDVLAR